MVYWIWLSRLQEAIGYKEIAKLMKKYQTPQEIWKKNKIELQEDGIALEIIKKVESIEYRRNLEKYEKYMKNNEIFIITQNSKQYPENLKHIYDSPFVLYGKGNKEILNKFSISMVGSRDCSNYGKYVAQKLAYELSKRNMVIVSGLAKGIDTFSHIGCIKACKSTIAVIGNGLDTIYPIENEKLYYKILQNNGAIISEYPLGAKPEKKHFPARNRIISGMTKGLIIVEAKRKSGALITADFALEQGKEVFCIPGNITSMYSEGTNQLLKEGAKMVTCIKDILEEY